MGATISMIYSAAVDATVGTVVSGAVSSITSTYEMQEELDVTLYSLQQEVMKIRSAIYEARKRRITNPQLFVWLASLIDAIYLGNYYLRISKNRTSFPPMIDSDGTGILPVSTFYRANRPQHTVTKLLFGNDKLEKLPDVVKMLRSIDVCSFLLMVNAHPERPIKICVYMDPNRLLNRDKEREQVMNFLFQPTMACADNVDILPIIGASGIGKTSLALHCFCDPKVQNNFSIKIYISRSNITYPNCGLPTIFESILERCNSIDINNFDENTLIAMLKQNLSSERFLLLMDNVWRVDSTVWNALYDCLKCGKQGSKVLVVSDLTRYDENKGIINPGKVEPIMLEGFSEDEYMLFFKEHAFGSGDAEDYPELVRIGEKIAQKMNGSIWGAKILGELLRDNLHASFWSVFLQDGVLSSEFQWSKNLLPVSNTISQLLPNRPKVENLIITWGEDGVQRLCRELKSFRELMVLGPSHCTPVIKDGKDFGVQFLVTKHFNLYEWSVATAICKSTRNERKFLLGDTHWITFINDNE